jgi:glycosyltransferase involved in cell wall biosynthesis
MSTHRHIEPHKYKITVFTPAYNRAGHLNKLYDTLCIQTFKDFEWVVVNDGSTDQTEEVLLAIQEDNIIELTLISQPNAGKHIAINTGANAAQGELFFIVDSDDWLPNDALENVNHYWETVKSENKQEQFAGVSGNRIHSDGTVNGGDVPYDVLDTNVFTYRHRMGIKGDKAEVYLTNVLKQYPFPTFDGEKFCPESLVWYRIGEKYDLRFFNKGIYSGDYLDGGLTASSKTIRAKSPRYTAITYKEMVNNTRSPLLAKIKASINYWRFSPYNKYQTFLEKLGDLEPFWSIATWPIGHAFYLKEKSFICQQKK